jgi:sarcosine/dimethylglycine N-methyltransferase
MPTVQELYELWAAESELRETLARSLGPRGLDSLYDTLAGLGPQPGDLLVDVGARDGKHARELAERFGVRTVALDPVPQHPDVVKGTAESLPFDDASVDWIWCRDVLVHVDVPRALAEFARVLRPGGAAVVYVTLPTDRLEPREAAELAQLCALTGYSADEVDAAARDAGLVEVSVDRLGVEWRERMLEDGTWDARADLLELARLQRGRETYLAQYGAAALDAARGGAVWGIYQLLGKLCPTVYVWRKP